MASTNIKVMVQGRIVFTVGDLFKGDVAKVYGSQTPKMNKQGQQYREYGFGLAVPKSVLGQMGPGQPGEIWAKIHEAAYTLFPNRQIPANFHMKYKDGDTGTNQDGTPVNTKQGYPGHMVFTCKSTIAPKFFRYENGQNFQINEGIKCGDYVNVQLSIEVNPGVNAGLYLNPMAVQFLGYGAEIVNTPSGDSIFGTSAPQIPQGASALPMAPQGMLVPNAAPQAPTFAQTPAYAQQPAAIAPAHYGVLPTPFQQPAAPQGMPTPFQQPAAPQGMPTPAMPGIPQPR